VIPTRGRRVIGGSGASAAAKEAESGSCGVDRAAGTRATCSPVNASPWPGSHAAIIQTLASLREDGAHCGVYRG